MKYLTELILPVTNLFLFEYLLILYCTQRLVFKVTTAITYYSSIQDLAFQEAGSSLHN